MINLGDLIFILYKKLSQYYQNISNLSVDVVIGVIANALSVSFIFKTEISPYWLIGLASGTWLIYILDHVIDNIRSEGIELSGRHYFIKKNIRVVYGLLLFLVLTILYCAYKGNNVHLIQSGFIVVAIVILHLALARINSLRKSLFNNKEFGVALVYALSIYIFPILQVSVSAFVEPIFYAFILLLLITYQSLLFCSIVDFRIDRQLHNASFVQVIGITKSKLVFIGVSLSILVFCWVIHLFYPIVPYTLFLLYVAMTLLHVVLFSLYLQNKNLPYRRLAELIFWLPFLMLFI